MYIVDLIVFGDWIYHVKWNLIYVGIRTILSLLPDPQAPTPTHTP